MTETTEMAAPEVLLLHEVSASGFRSLAALDGIALQPELTVLTGQNDGGKTALLDAIRFLLGDRVPDADDLTRGDEDRFTEAMVVGLFATAGGQRPVQVRARFDASGTLARELRTHVHRQLGKQPAGLPLPELRQAFQKLGIPSPGGQAKLPFVEAAEEWLATRPPDEFQEDWVPLPTNLRDRLPRVSYYESRASPDPQSHILSEVRKHVTRLLEDRHTEATADLKAEVVKGVEPQLDDLRAHIHRRNDALEDVRIEITIDFTRPTVQARLRFLQGGHDIDLAKAGQGRLRRTSLAVYEHTLQSLRAGAEVVRGDILLYDEPDTSLDYRSQRELFDIVTEQARLPHAQVMVATHSLNFIDRVPLRSLHHFKLDEKHRTEVEVLKGMLQSDQSGFFASICSGLGLRNSVLLDERRFLVVEGETEEMAIPQLFVTAMNKGILEAGVVLLNTRGVGAVRSMTEVLKHEWGRDVVVLADRDAERDVQDWISRLGLVEGDNLFLIGANEFEDAFSDTAWVRALLHSFPVADGGGPWLEGDLRAMRAGDKFSRELENGVARRHRGQVRKPHLGLALANSATRDDIPQELLHCFQALLA